MSGVHAIIGDALTRALALDVHEGTRRDKPRLARGHFDMRDASVRDASVRDATAAPPPAALPAPPAVRPVHTWRATVGAYISLMKPHVTVLLLGTTLASMVVAEHGMPALRIVLATLLGGAMAAGSANAINCYWDRDIDSLMARTHSR